MRYIEGADRKQITLLPDCIEDLVGQDSPVRVVDAFVNNLDLEDAGFKRFVPNATGRASLRDSEVVSWSTLFTMQG